MAYHKSSKKRIRSTETKRAANRYQARTARNSVKNLRNTSDKEEAKKVPALKTETQKSEQNQQKSTVVIE